MSGLKKFNINDLKEVEKYSINRLSDYEINNLKFIKVMFGTASRAGSGFEYKIDKVNETDNWHPETKDSKDIGGFNFSVEEKILRWLVRGDTLYDVIIPENTEVYDCESPSAPHGVFRSNKIIVTNPKPVTDEMAMDFYKKSILPEKSYFKAMAGCATRGYINTAIQIFRDKVNKENVNLAFEEFKNFVTPNDKEEFSEEYLGEYTKKIYDMFIELINM